MTRSGGGHQHSFATPIDVCQMVVGVRRHLPQQAMQKLIRIYEYLCLYFSVNHLIPLQSMFHLPTVHSVRVLVYSAHLGGLSEFNHETQYNSKELLGVRERMEGKGHIFQKGQKCALKSLHNWMKHAKTNTNNSIWLK